MTMSISSPAAPAVAAGNAAQAAVAAASAAIATGQANGGSGAPTPPPSGAFGRNLRGLCLNPRRKRRNAPGKAPYSASRATSRQPMSRRQNSSGASIASTAA